MDKTPVQEKKPLLTIVESSTPIDPPFTCLLIEPVERYSTLRLVRNSSKQDAPDASAIAPASPMDSH